MEQLLEKSKSILEQQKELLKHERTFIFILTNANIVSKLMCRPVQPKGNVYIAFSLTFEPSLASNAQQESLKHSL